MSQLTDLQAQFTEALATLETANTNVNNAVTTRNAAKAQLEADEQTLLNAQGSLTVASHNATAIRRQLIALGDTPARIPGYVDGNANNP